MKKASHFRINTLKVIHETIEGETVLVNLDSGTYYSLDGMGADLWRLIEGGTNAGAIVDWVACRYEGERAEMEKAVHLLLGDLQQEGLIVIDEEKEYENIVEHDGHDKVSPGERIKNFIHPVLHKYTDMQDLLLLDPIHDVDETGWPSSKDDLPAGSK